MSTYYEIVCHDHKERVDACSRTATGKGNSHVGDSLECLGPFLVKHCGCRLECISEYDRRTEYPDGEMCEWKMWTADGIQEGDVR